MPAAVTDVGVGPDIGKGRRGRHRGGYWTSRVSGLSMKGLDAKGRKPKRGIRHATRKRLVTANIAVTAKSLSTRLT
jgi:hypothetical protein